jgi:hypothetical protein
LAIAGNAERAHALDVVVRRARELGENAAASLGANVAASSAAIASVGAQPALTEHLHHVARDG